MSSSELECVDYCTNSCVGSVCNRRLSSCSSCAPSTESSGPLTYCRRLKQLAEDKVRLDRINQLEKQREKKERRKAKAKAKEFRRLERLEERRNQNACLQELNSIATAVQEEVRRKKVEQLCRQGEEEKEKEIKRKEEKEKERIRNELKAKEKEEKRLRRVELRKEKLKKMRESSIVHTIQSRECSSSHAEPTRKGGFDQPSYQFSLLPPSYFSADGVQIVPKLDRLESQRLRRSEDFLPESLIVETHEALRKMTLSKHGEQKKIGTT